MTRVSLLSSPMMLGFEEIERLIDRAAKGTSEGYPPYNIERATRGDDHVCSLRGGAGFELATDESTTSKAIVWTRAGRDRVLVS